MLVEDFDKIFSRLNRRKTEAGEAVARLKQEVSEVEERIQLTEQVLDYHRLEIFEGEEAPEQLPAVDAYLVDLYTGYENLLQQMQSLQSNFARLNQMHEAAERCFADACSHYKVSLEQPKTAQPDEEQLRKNLVDMTIRERLVELGKIYGGTLEIGQIKDLLTKLNIYPNHAAAANAIYPVLSKSPEFAHVGKGLYRLVNGPVQTVGGSTTVAVAQQPVAVGFPP
ncbi:hypothetical protein ISF26_06145 [Gloeobacter morelensis MG652769]|uniref:Uncharacterized protein n=2 Tax=Gloeobacter TaxID=33071 RepID=A0ABY3PQ94_9CYAN|nr:hypothetical protein ISF26_06145 [Gloeobacter morelensis MG652769]